MTIVKDFAGLSDSWAVTHPPESLPSSQTTYTPQEALELYGVTADSPLNTYSAGKPLEPYARKHWGKRLDYVFYRQPVPNPLKRTSYPVISCSHCKVIMTGHCPGCSYSFSDHFGLESTLDITDAPVPTALPEDYCGALSVETVDTTMNALATCYRNAKKRSRHELVIFLSCLVLLIAVIVASAFFPHAWINPIFVLVSVALAWLATTMLYEGFLYGNWECNALMNVIEELEIYRHTLSPSSPRT
jgi:sphingomyelin phosphodiesterase 2